MGNKVSIKEEFENLAKLETPDQVREMLDRLLRLNLNDEEIKLNIFPQNIRKLIQEKPDIFKKMMVECIHHVFLSASSGKIFTSDETLYLNNHLRLLIRFLPVLHEQIHKQFVKEVLWTKIGFPNDKRNLVQEKNAANIMDDCLAIKLMHSLFVLLFYPEYTISNTKNPDPKKFKISGLEGSSAHLWKFYNNDRNDNDNQKYHGNRTKVLECLLACFSAPILNPFNSKERSGDPWIHFCVSPKNPYLLSALMSFLNFGISFQENSIIPYKQFITSDVSGEKLALLSLQLFCLFADIKIDEVALYHKVVDNVEYQQVIEYYLKRKEQKQSIDPHEITNTEVCKEVLQNGCILFLRDIVNTEYYEFISSNVLRILQNPYEYENAFLPESIKRTILLEEVMLVFWRIIEHNKTYIQRLFYQKEFLSIVVHLLYQAHENFAEASRSGIFYLVVLILSKLSADRFFSVQLKKKFLNDIGFTKIPIFIGTHIDLIFVVFLYGMIDSYLNYYFCYQNNLLAVLHNIAPFAKDLSPVTCSLLVQLIKVVSRPEILKMDKNNLLILRKTLNLLHKILCYQPETNPNLLYELIAQRNDLEYLRKLPLKKIYAKSSTISDKKSPDKDVTLQGGKPADNNSKVVEEEKKQNESIQEIQKDKEPSETKVEESKENPENKENPEDNQQKNKKPVAFQLFDDKWMELYAYNMTNDLIFLVIDYLSTQMRLILKDKIDNDDEIRTFISEQSLIGIVPHPGPIMVEVVNDPDNINSILFLFLWNQIYLKCHGLPYFDPEDVRLLNVGGIQ